MPPKKQQLDEVVWQWAEQVEPSAVTWDHVQTAYRTRLKPCKLKSCRRNCKGNPRCVNALGEGKWFSEIADSYWHEIDDPENECRKEGSFAGLKNLGATCYVNTFLQVWFHNPEIREAVFGWKEHLDKDTQAKLSCDLATLKAVTMPEELDRLFTPQNICAHLQNVFALLQFSRRRYIDPTPFINSLGLDAGLQQDAQEFSKLFMSLLEDTLSQYQSEEGRAFTQQFMGQYQYATRCSFCATESRRPSEFYELDLNIKGHKNLHDCIGEFLKEEKLEGDNKYQCSGCNSKQDATRCIQLCKLPTVLNLQLLRFVFERQTGHKKKLNTYIEFPESIDLSKYMAKPDGTVVYDLAAVLIHRGPSAYSGHYVAHIKDSQSKTWYKFNDEQIEKMGGKNLQLGNEDELEGKGPKKPKTTKGFHASRNAYMLVYHQQKENSLPVPESVADQTVSSSVPVNSDPQKQLLNMVTTAQNGCDSDSRITSSDGDKDTIINNQDDDNVVLLSDGNQGSSDDCSTLPSSKFKLSMLPLRVQRYLDWDNSQFAEWVKEMSNIRDQSVVKGKARQKEVLEVFHILPWQDGEEMCWVGSDWLSKWMTSDSSDGLPQIGTTGLRCTHNKLDPDKVPKAKCISKQAAEILYTQYGGKDRLDRDSMCLDCVKERCQVIRTKARMADDNRVITAFTRAKDETLRAENCYWVGKASLRSWRRLALEELQAKTEGLVNGNKSNGEHTDPESKQEESKTHSINDEDCKQSADASATAASTSSHEPTATKDSAAAKTPNDEQSDGLKFNEDILCASHDELAIEENGRRLVPVELWTRLRWYFPRAPQFRGDSGGCAHCLALVENDVQQKARNKALAAEQKAQLQDLYMDRKRPSWQEGQDNINIVSADFVNMWRSFIRDSQRSSQPEETNNSSLLCPHGGFLYNPEILGLDSSTDRLYKLYPHEWATLKKYAKADVEIEIFRVKEDTGHVTFIVTPDICTECQEARKSAELQSRLKYRDAVIFVRKLLDDNTIAATSEEKAPANSLQIGEDTATVADGGGGGGGVSPRHVNGSTDPDYIEESDDGLQPPSKMAKLDPAASAGSIRRSSRHRKARGEKEITVSSTHSLRDLKLQIMASFSVAPFDQNLTLNGRALSGDQDTLETLKVLPGDTVYLRADEPVEDPTFLEDVPKSSYPEEGFKGTGLLSRS